MTGEIYKNKAAFSPRTVGLRMNRNPATCALKLRHISLNKYFLCLLDGCKFFVHFKHFVNGVEFRC